MSVILLRGTLFELPCLCSSAALVNRYEDALPLFGVFPLMDLNVLQRHTTQAPLSEMGRQEVHPRR